MLASEIGIGGRLQGLLASCTTSQKRKKRKEIVLALVSATTASLLRYVDNMQSKRVTNPPEAHSGHMLLLSGLHSKSRRGL
eukprot:4411339-Amphidinium_carterae.1